MPWGPSQGGEGGGWGPGKGRGRSKAGQGGETFWSMYRPGGIGDFGEAGQNGNGMRSYLPPCILPTATYSQMYFVMI